MRPNLLAGRDPGRGVARLAMAALSSAAVACGGASAATPDAGKVVGGPGRPDPQGIGDPSEAKDAGEDHTVKPPPMMKPPRGLHVSATSILDGDDKPVRLHGVNRSGTEYACVGGYGIFDGPSDAASIAAMKTWNVNAVRIPLNEDCWLGINAVDPDYAGQNYRSAIVAYAQLLLANGVYPVLDLHWSAPGDEVATGQEPMPDLDHSVTFWGSVAMTFKAYPDAIFELYNEPWPDNDQDTDTAWACWQNGGGQDDETDGGNDGGPCSNVGFAVAGMQTLVTTVREAGAANLLLLGGVEYSNALTEWVAHMPRDPQENLAAAWHIYAGEACSDDDCWNGTNGGTGAPLAVAQTVPIVATEIGDDGCDAAFPTDVMTWLDGQGQSYLGWAWDTYGDCSNYAIISDYDGTPNGVYGTAFQTHFLAQ